MPPKSAYQLKRRIQQVAEQMDFITVTPDGLIISESAGHHELISPYKIEDMGKEERQGVLDLLVELRKTGKNLDLIRKVGDATPETKNLAWEIRTMERNRKKLARLKAKQERISRKIHAIR